MAPNTRGRSLCATRLCVMISETAPHTFLFLDTLRTAQTRAKGKKCFLALEITMGTGLTVLWKVKGFSFSTMAMYIVGKFCDSCVCIHPIYIIFKSNIFSVQQFPKQYDGWSWGIHL